MTTTDTPSKAPLSSKELKHLDKKMISTLAEKMHRSSTQQLQGIPFRNEQVMELCAAYLEGDISTLESFLTAQGTLTVNIEKRAFKDIDGAERDLTIARAAGTDMWPMGTHYWVRDNALIAGRLLGINEFAAPSPIDESLGKAMLLSALTVMSSCAQLVRFQSIIAHPELADDPNNWPHIFLAIADNLHGAKTEQWMHIQDAWQMCIYHTLRALQTGQLKVSELDQKHCSLLGLVAPFLAQVDYSSCSNAGSWEELGAVRSSVVCWETALLEILKDLSKGESFSFLETELKRYQPRLPVSQQQLSLGELCSELLDQGLEALTKQLPFESPAYSPSDARYREADAALIYTLQLRIPEQLARHGKLSVEAAEELEQKIVGEVLKLQDPVSHAIKRYLNDSYQREGYFRNSTVVKLKELYGGASGEASGAEEFVERDKVVPKGREAAWVHFVFQLSAWAGRKFLSSNLESWGELHQRTYLHGLSLITGQNEYSIAETGSGENNLIAISVYRIPECYISDQTPDGDLLVFASPHTPLNWAVAEALDAFAVAKEVLLSRG